MPVVWSSKECRPITPSSESGSGNASPLESQMKQAQKEVETFSADSRDSYNIPERRYMKSHNMASENRFANESCQPVHRWHFNEGYSQSDLGAHLYYHDSKTSSLQPEKALSLQATNDLPRGPCGKQVYGGQSCELENYNQIASYDEEENSERKDASDNSSVCSDSNHNHNSNKENKDPHLLHIISEKNHNFHHPEDYSGQKYANYKYQNPFFHFPPINAAPRHNNFPQNHSPQFFYHPTSHMNYPHSQGNYTSPTYSYIPSKENLAVSNESRCLRNQQQQQQQQQHHRGYDKFYEPENCFPPQNAQKSAYVDEKIGVETLLYMANSAPSGKYHSHREEQLRRMKSESFLTPPITPTPAMFNQSPASYSADSSCSVRILQEPCKVQLRSKPDKSYMIRPPPKVEILGPFNSNTDYIQVTLLECIHFKEIKFSDVRVLEGNIVDLNQRRSFNGNVATFSDLRIMVKPSTLTRNGYLIFKFELLSRGSKLCQSVFTISTTNMTLYSNYTQMNPEDKKQYMAANPKRKQSAFTMSRSISLDSSLYHPDILRKRPSFDSDLEQTTKSKLRLVSLEEEETKASTHES